MTAPTQEAAIVYAAAQEFVSILHRYGAARTVITLGLDSVSAAMSINLYNREGRNEEGTVVFSNEMDLKTSFIVRELEEKQIVIAKVIL